MLHKILPEYLCNIFWKKRLTWNYKCSKIVIKKGGEVVLDMKAINFKVDSELYKQIKIRALELDMTLKDYIVSLVQKDLKTDSKK